MKPHAFIAMPFGLKPGPDGQGLINFDRVHKELLAPALARAGFEVFRADEELRAGDIRTDMFQELLIADLVVADLTIANPNVWYELGVRHALRMRGVVLVYGTVNGSTSAQAFDVYTDRKLRYALTPDGVPDPARRGACIEQLTAMARETLESSTRRLVSPVYSLLPHLQQPQWKKLLLSGTNEFSDAYKEWAQRLELARRCNQPGDILTLADETPTRALALEARITAGTSLLKLQQPALALEQFEAALAIDPGDIPSRQKKAICLGRLHRFDEARGWVHALIGDAASDAENWALAGRVEKDSWVERWRPRGGAGTVVEPAALLAAATGEDALLEEAIVPYRTAFAADPGHCYSGINALTLTVMRAHLGGPVRPEDTEALRGGVRWAIDSTLERSPRDYWARASRAELSLLCADAATVGRDWRAAIAAADKDWFALDSSRQTLLLLRDLGFRPAETTLALDIVEREIRRSEPPFVPRQVLLFSGHMMDQPGREKPRFPPAMEGAAADRLNAALAHHDAGPADLALCQAAAGGDLLFLEACVARGVRCQVMLPLEEPEFVQRSILPSIDGARWRQRWAALKPRLGTPLRMMPADLGPPPRGTDPFERGNRWLLNTALAHGPDKLRFICLWNGAGGDGPGGTQHLMAEAQQRTGEVWWVDTRDLLPAGP
ncbi:hypothetical protein C7444_101222 [Sphaerotilus hippei]|uniref:Uncharacterized protein n=1 Tax=Sphaerotilus hippei TaxID=744406 RepID=A0A318HAV3_9BURK|nr:tetratricopeptide repeat-containing protein [Sphaerotilus hippei]PXW99392.1 hypothetical protein C7444_101222 [Sphaerotilus hippei]